MNVSWKEIGVHLKMSHNMCYKNKVHNINFYTSLKPAEFTKVPSFLILPLSSYSRRALANEQIETFGGASGANLYFLPLEKWDDTYIPTPSIPMQNFDVFEAACQPLSSFAFMHISIEWSILYRYPYMAANCQLP